MRHPIVMKCDKCNGLMTVIKNRRTNIPYIRIVTFFCTNTKCKGKKFYEKYTHQQFFRTEIENFHRFYTYIYLKD